MVLIKEVSPRGTSYPKDGQQLWNKKDGRDDANWFGILFLEKVQKEEDDEDKDGVKEECYKPGQKLLWIFLGKIDNVTLAYIFCVVTCCMTPLTRKWYGRHQKIMKANGMAKQAPM